MPSEWAAAPDWRVFLMGMGIPVAHREEKETGPALKTAAGVGMDDDLKAAVAKESCGL